MNTPKKRYRIRIRRFIFVCILFLCTISIALGGCIYFQLNKVKGGHLAEKDKELGIGLKENSRMVPKESAKPEGTKEEVVNIALFGVDSGREKDDVPRSDTIMVLSVDRTHKKIKLSSIMRDSYVKVEKLGMTKINSAYANGGAQLAVKTINQNFDMDVREYITVDFFGLEKIVDSLGGLDLTVKKYEVGEINKYEKELANLEKKKSTPVMKSGKLHLNGMQTVAYARIRKVGDGDFERTQRQKEVISAMLAKTQGLGPLKATSFISKLLPFVETSMSKAEMLMLGSELLVSGIKTLEWSRFPLDGYCKGKVINKIWYLEFDSEATSKHLHQFVYDDIKPEPKEPLF